MVKLQPTLRHSRLLPGCIHTAEILDMAPCSRCPKHQKVLTGGWWWVAWHLLHWYFHVSNTGCTSVWILWCHHTWLAKRIHFARSLNECRMLHNILYMVMSGIVQWSWCLLLPVHIFWVGHQSKLCRGMAHPICGDNFCRWVSFCSPLVVHSRQP